MYGLGFLIIELYHNRRLKSIFIGGCVKFLHRGFRCISASSALSAILADYASESRKAQRTRKTQKKRVLLKSPYNRQINDSQEDACSTFILHYDSPHTIHLDSAVAHSSLIVLSFYNNHKHQFKDIPFSWQVI